MNWQKIDTAPEGKDILLWTPSGQLVGYQWKRGLWHASGVKASDEGCDVELFEAPTHWMTAPADPVGATSTVADEPQNVVAAYGGSPKGRASFADVCAMLPDGFEWGDPLTVVMARSIVDAAMAAERELCAKIADDHDPSEDVSACDTAEQIAAKIRGA